MNLFNKQDKGFPSQKEWFCSENCSSKSSKSFQNKVDLLESFRGNIHQQNPINRSYSQQSEQQDIDLDLDMETGF